MSRFKGWLKIAAINLLILLIILSLAEAGLAWLLNHPSSIKGPLVPVLRNYYQAFDRRIIQYLPECAQYDQELFYILKPGRCRFKNREYDTEVSINSLGVRSDEASLKAPAIIVLGDSHAMGWGLPAQDSFASIIAEKTGLTVLNAAISSYGTVRETTLLKRLDRSNLKILIIQYSDNDYVENRAFLKTGRLEITPESEYQNLVRDHRKSTAYYPFKYVHGLLRLLNRMVKQKFEDQEPRPTDNEQARAFLDVLAKSGLDLSGVKILVIEINDWAGNDSGFIQAVKAGSQSGQYPEFVGDITALDLSEGIGPEKYYTLDGHMLESGHEYAAQRILEALRQIGFSR